ncbi:uncharacterized protein YpiB (UPF0302 family) [Pullulanibacillus pueri]|uniref:UPF0302 protein GCM10007096_13110 n=1 Tax=Pullulanibacillus pueri TaxID=1437324 RepID=A0A8J3ELD6_9BACL|nr:ReoY family proteolytic degradation factor [Pullulanibacillus pueri]MBM7681452.1 uncharacterized protein YpiB (UPF0302 family) [Pullulanibacillus pueri]GGH78934.1 UPF0302 protein [Pullulanibacillus pueri]
MEQMISIEEKRSFLKWFLRSYQLKSRECIWLLNYILSDEHLLGLLKFVDNISGCPRAIVVSEKNVPHPAFIYRKQEVETHEPEKAFHDIRMDQEEAIYIHLMFPSSSRSSEYVSILEENPYDRRHLSDRYGEEVKLLIEKSEKQFMMTYLEKKIDESLEKKDKNQFERLVAELQKLMV